MNKRKKVSCLVKYRFVDSDSSENPLETSDQGNYIGQVQVLRNIGWASKTAKGKWQQSWGPWQGKCQVVMGNSGQQKAEDWHRKVLRQSSPGGIVLKAASKIKTKWEDKWPPGLQDKKYGMDFFQAVRGLLQGNLAFRKEIINTWPYWGLKMGWGVGSVEKVLAAWAWEPEFGSQNREEEAGRSGSTLLSQSSPLLTEGLSGRLYLKGQGKEWQREAPYADF